MFKYTRNENGFTMFELLTAVVIMGIISAIAIPTYKNTRARAYDASVKQDQHSFVMKIEGLLITGSTVPQLAVNDLPDEGVQQTRGGWHYYTPTGPYTYKVCSWNENGKELNKKDGVWVYNSVTRVPVKQASCDETFVG